MNQKSDSGLNSKMRKLVYVFTAFFVISVILFNNTNTVYSSSNDGIISGIATGNTGERYGTFVSCSSLDVTRFFESSTLQFKTSSSDASSGSWVLTVILEDSLNKLSIGGPITQSFVYDNEFTILGLQSFDEVCNTTGDVIQLNGGCGKNTKISFTAASDEKVGSYAPPDGDKIYYLFGDNVQCG